MSLKQKAINGAKWSAISSVMTIGLGILQLALLARMIDPKQFGLLTIALVILTLVDTLSDFGLSNSVIQRKSMSETELSTLYWLNIFIGLAVFAIIYLSSHAISVLLQQPELNELIETLSVAFIIIPQGQQFRALLQKELAFTLIGRTEVIAAISGFAVTLLSAVWSPSALCAIWGYLTMVSIRMLLFCYYGGKIYRPQFVFELKSVRSNLRYGGYLTADSLINQLGMNMPTMLLSRLLGAVATGGYNLAYNLAVMPPAKINPILSRVLFPAFAQMQDDQPRLRHNFYKMLSIMSLLNFVALLGMAGIAHNLVLSLFGERWLFIAPVLQILCIAGIMRAINNPVGALVMAKGAVDISSKLNALRLALSVPVIWVGAQWGGLTGATIGFTALQIFTALTNYFVLIRPLLGASAKAYLTSQWLPLRMALPTLCISYTLGYALEEMLPVALTLTIQIAAGGLVWVLMLLRSQDPLILELKQIVLRKTSTARTLKNNEKLI
ncbi:MOP flippase family protein [Pantoea alhagi]|uniref:MOP flippase family protein n=1 Tax=Pantoea alhagi TaxID=1891675 RepID=UPI00202B1005|nr:MOP flippase family protein [Pantoea alhagi]URQ60731.1 MOP flippase family protein [Pantoea alhagi]